MNITAAVREAARRAVSTTAPRLLLARIAEPAVLLPYYHLVSDKPVAHTRHLYPHKTIREFTKDLEFLARNYRPVDLPELLRGVNGVAPSRKAFHLTFDDGFREMSDIVGPILRKAGIPATFFVNSAFVDNRELCYLHQASLLHGHLHGRPIPPGAARKISDLLCRVSPREPGRASDALNVNYRSRQILVEAAQIVGLDFGEYLTRSRPYLTSTQIQALLDDGFTIGAHSIDHPLYAELTLVEQLQQTAESVKAIQQWFNLPYAAFAFPHNDRGVSREFFERAYRDGSIDISFGTSGITTDACGSNLQRISFEKPVWPAERIVRYHLAKRVYNVARGRRHLARH